MKKHTKIITIVGIILIVLVIGVVLFIEYMKKPVCGNGVIEKGETSENCCIDVDCPENYDCINGKCINLLSPGSSGVPAPAEIMTFTQPNGNVFQGRIFGDEWANHVETLDGYTIIRNSNEDYWTYAFIKNGTLTPSSYIVMVANPDELNLTKHLAPKRDVNCNEAKI